MDKVEETSRPSGGVHGHDQLGILADLPAHQEPLLVAPAQMPHGRGEVRDHHVKALHQLPGVPKDGGSVQAAQPAHKRPLPLPAQDTVLHHVEAQRQAKPRPVLRHVCQASPVQGQGSRNGTTSPSSRISPASGRRNPVSACTSSLWSFPSMPAIPRISPSRTSKVRPHTAGLPWSLRTRSPRTASTGLPGDRGVRPTLGVRACPTMSSASRSKVAGGGGELSDHPSLTEHHHPVADLQDLPELVGDKDDSGPRSRSLRRNRNRSSLMPHRRASAGLRN